MCPGGWPSLPRYRGTVGHFEKKNYEASYEILVAVCIYRTSCHLWATSSSIIWHLIYNPAPIHIRVIMEKKIFCDPLCPVFPNRFLFGGGGYVLTGNLPGIHWGEKYHRVHIDRCIKWEGKWTTVSEPSPLGFAPLGLDTTWESI
jgi:hypothetical protein